MNSFNSPSRLASSGRIMHNLARLACMTSNIGVPLSLQLQFSMYIPLHFTSDIAIIAMQELEPADDI